MFPAYRFPSVAKRRWPLIVSWCLYDWASASFPVVMLTFIFAPYFTESVAADSVGGTVLWGQAMAVAGLLVATASMLLGAIGDLKGGRRRWLGVAALVGMAATAALWFVVPDRTAIPLALIGIVTASIAFETAAIFYNALLPEVAQPSHFGRISGWGNAAGAVGGILCLGIVLTVFVMAEAPPFGLDPQTQETIRVCAPFTALWWLLFSLPLFLVPQIRPGLPPERRPWRVAIRHGVGNLVAALRTLPRQPRIGWYLLAQMLYMDGINTLLAFVGIFAAGTLGMPMSEVLMFGIATNVACAVGSCAFGWIDDHLGARRTVVIGLAGMIVCLVGLLSALSIPLFWLLGLTAAVFLGPVQAASRSLMARMTFPENRAQMFGLYAVSGKITAFLGPAAFSLATDLTGSQRGGMATIVPFLLAGLLLLAAKVADAPAPQRSE